MKMVFTDAGTVSQGDLDTARLEAHGELVCYESDTVGEEQLARFADAQVIFCNKTRIGREEIDAAPKLEYIGLFATGYNNIDTEYARSRGITVCNAGSYSTEAVAQHTFALILELASKTDLYNSFVKDGGWQRSKFFSIFAYPNMEIYGKTIGIFGYGSIGKSVARIAKGFGMRVLACTRTKPQDDSVETVDFDTLLALSDIVSVHTPLTPETRGKFNADAFGKMKKGALFINTSRGPVVDEQALLDALKNGHLGGAGLDVLFTEPQSADCPFAKDHPDNLIITPHVAWAAKQTRERLMDIVADNLEAYISGAPQNVVN